MADKKPSDSPIPSIAKDDPEDVSWALSTAEAMWSRGDHVEAVKWIRRAAEAASEAEADDRALALAKAAADLAAQVGPIPQTAPPPPVAMAPLASPSAAPPPAPGPAPIARMVPPAPPSRPSAVPPPKQPVPKAPAAPPSSPTGAIAPRAALTGAKSVPPVARAAVTPARAPARRKSHANLSEEAKKAAKAIAIHQANETTVTVETPNLSEAPRRRARSKPSLDEITPSSRTPQAAAVAPIVPHIPPPRPAAGMPPAIPASPPSTDDMDQWPTQSLVGDDLDDDGAEKTRIGSPAYQEAAKRSVPPPAPVIPVETTQALRVVVWQAADGLRVAPQGTPVTGIALDAIIVALDPATDLASWFAARKT